MPDAQPSSAPPAPTGPPAPGSLRLASLAVLALVAAVYAQVAGFGFVNLDDQAYVYQNPLVLPGLSWAGVRAAFTSFAVTNYHPLTWLSHQLDVSLFGLDAGRHHLVNVALHAANALLLLAWLRRLTGRIWPSALVAALFAVHPLHVESVAWVSERKDVLSTAFLLLTLLAWSAWVERPAPGRYLLALFLFAAGLLAKPMLVTLPVLLLLLDGWPLGRRPLRAHLLEKVPFAALAGASAVVTWLAQSRGGAASSLEAVPLGWRVANGLVAAATYLWKALWPTGLAAFYPHPLLSGAGLPAWQVALSAALLLAMAGLAWRERARRPWLAWGLGWYLVTLLPVIGLVQVGTQAMADRYTYVPLIGPFVAAVWAGAELLTRLAVPAVLGAGAGLLPVLALSVVARSQVATWRDSETLHQRALDVTERNWNAWIGLGDARSEAGHPDAALPCYQRALEIRPDEAQAWSGLGVALARLGRTAEAEAPLRRAVALKPGLGEAWYNLGVALGALGRHGEAAEAFAQAVGARPDDARAWGNLAIASRLSGDAPATLRALERLRALDPAQAARLGEALARRAGALSAPGVLDPAGMSSSWPERHRSALAAAAVALAAALAYAGTLGHGFALDDVSEVVRNDHVHSLAEAPRLFAEGAWEGAGDVNPIYRPLTSITYALNHAVGGLAPVGYHLVNVLLHALCAALVLRLGLALGGTLAGAGAGALLFALHPIHAEVVANVAGRKDALATALVIATVLAHRQALRRGGWRLALAPLALAAALFSKETGAVAVGAAAAWDLLVEPGGWRGARRRAAGLYLGYLALVALYFLARRAAVGSAGVPLALIPFVENPLAHLPAAPRLLTAVAVLGRGLWLQLWPHPLSPDYSWSAIPLVESALDPRFLASVVALAALAAAAVAVRRARPALAFLALWYAGAIFPASNLLVPVGTIFGERLLYLPSVATCLAAGLLAGPVLSGRAAWPRLAGAALALLLGWRAAVAAAPWHDEVALFTAAAEAQPGSAKVHDLLGAALMEEGRDAEGVVELERGMAALAGLPPEVDTRGQRLKLGVAYERVGRLDEAEALYLAMPGFPDAGWRLGVVRWRQGRRAEAEGLWSQVVAAAPDHARAMTDLGLALRARGDLAGAEALWRRATEADPRAAGPWLALGDLYFSRGDVARAKGAWGRFLEQARYGVYPGQRERVEAQLRRLGSGGGTGP